MNSLNLQKEEQKNMKFKPKSKWEADRVVTYRLLSNRRGGLVKLTEFSLSFVEHVIWTEHATVLLRTRRKRNMFTETQDSPD